MFSFFSRDSRKDNAIRRLQTQLYEKEVSLEIMKREAAAWDQAVEDLIKKYIDPTQQHEALEDMKSRKTIVHKYIVEKYQRPRAAE